LPYALALQKLCNGNKDALQKLIDNEIIGIEDGNIIIQFLEEQFAEFGDVSVKRRKSALKRWNDAKAMQMQSKSNAIREEEIREEKKKEEKKKAVVIDKLPFDSDSFSEAWSNWVEHRIQLKKKLTPKTKEMQLRTLGAFSEQEAIDMINQSIGNGWTGLFELKNKANGKQNTNTPESRAAKLAEYFAAKSNQ
jgi:hypothetical protein